MTVNRKELYEQKVQDTVIKLADYMISHSVDGILTMRAAELRHALKVNIHVYNEASGRLQAIGFHSGVKKFNAHELRERKDKPTYYYRIFPERHPFKLKSV